MLLRISHETKLSYTAPVAETVFEVRMAPPTDEDQTNLGYRLRTTPQSPVTSYRDGMGNRVDLFNVTKPYSELVILATSYVRTHRRPAVARLGRRRPHHPRVRRRRPRRGRLRPGLLRRPAQQGALEGPGRGDDLRHRQGRADRPRPDGMERVVAAQQPARPVPVAEDGRNE